MNAVVNSYEGIIFHAANQDSVVMLPKTQQTGTDFSDNVLLNQISMELPKPFIWEYRSSDRKECFNVVFYDNAGEHFQPGADVLANPATRHLSCSDGILFMFDPINDANLRHLCDPADPQLQNSEKLVNQNILLSEMIHRIKRHANMNSTDVCDIPLVVAVAKSDALSASLPWIDEFPPVFSERPGSSESVLNIDAMLNESFALRELLLQYCPGMVNDAESFFRNVCYVAISNFGTPAKIKPDGGIGIIPAQIRPHNVELPFLYFLCRRNLIGKLTSRGTSDPGFTAKIENDRIVFRHPETGKTTRLPLTYCGATLLLGGKKCRMPDDNSKSPAAKNAEFWS